MTFLRYEKLVVWFKINNENDEFIRFRTLASILCNIDFKCTQLFRDQNYNSEQTCDKLWHASQKAPLKVIITNYAQRVGEVHFRRSIKISIQLQYFWTSFKIGSKNWSQIIFTVCPANPLVQHRANCAKIHLRWFSIKFLFHLFISAPNIHLTDN